MRTTKDIEIDDTIEERITMDIVVDAYNEDERAMGWYYYLESKLGFPFQGKCIEKRSISPLKPDQALTVIGMADTDECLRDMLVEIEYGEDDPLCVPLSQIVVTSGDGKTREAVADWHYWLKRGYQF